MEVANNAQHFIFILSLLLLIVPALSFSFWKHSNQDIQQIKEKFLHRIERQTKDKDAPKEDCITSLFETMQSCCPVPLLVPTEPQDRCTGGHLMSVGLFHRMRETVISPFRNARKDVDPEVMKQKVIAGQMCTIECTFKEMKLLMDDGKMDLNKTEEFFNNLVMSKKIYKTSEWIKIVKQALSECSADIENLPITTVNSPHAEGKTCSTQCGYYMQCARRAFILNCPVNEFSISEGCVAARARLVKCNPLEVLKAVKPPSE